MSVVPSLSSLAALLLLVGRVATQGKCFLVVCVGEEQGAAERQERSSLGKCRRLGGNGGKTLKATAKGNKGRGTQEAITFQLKG